MRVMYVGFKGKNNASFQLLSVLGGDKLYLTNSFEGLKKDIDAELGKYDLVIMFGIDKTLRDTVRIETTAKYNGDEEKTEAKTQELNSYFVENGIDSFISNIPTAYLCNAAYYHMLKKTKGKAVFIHIPTTKNMSEYMMNNLSKVIERIESYGNKNFAFGSC